MAKGKNIIDNEETFLVEEAETAINAVEEKAIETIEPIKIEDSKIYKAEVVETFGKTFKGSTIEKKGSIIKILLEKKLIKLV